MDCHFAWQAWHLRDWVTRWGAAGVRLVAAHCAWQAWHLVTWTVTWRGRRCTVSHGLPLCVAGVALTGLDWFCKALGCVGCSQWDLGALCLDMFTQLVTCKQRHVNIAGNEPANAGTSVHYRLFACGAGSEKNWKLAIHSAPRNLWSSSRRGHISLFYFTWGHVTDGHAKSALHRTSWCRHFCT